MKMTFEQLRLKHPRLVYTSYDLTVRDNTIVVTYDFRLEPDITFHPTVTIPHTGNIDTSALAPYIFNVGLVEAISYWKAACPREIVVEAGPLSEEQLRFWYDLFIHGLGEFFYRNNIDFTQTDFLKIIPAYRAEIANDSTDSHRLTDTLNNVSVIPNTTPSDLILVGGGKDSAVTLGMLKQSDRTLQTMVLNPTAAALATIRTAGLSDSIIVRRTIDPKLLELNAAGYLNGHTPFSAYLAFLGVLVGRLNGNENVIVSNEQSANEGNVIFHGMEINHQYSKSFRFEQQFRTYSGTFLPSSPSYFSFLRPLNDVQIGMLFAAFPAYYQSFRSCNAGSATGVWCGACPKCAFTYLILFPFLAYQDMLRIFGRDYFTDPVIMQYVSELVGLTPVKPFECVGTRDEAKLAVYLSVETYIQHQMEVPEGLLKIKSDLRLTPADVAHLKENIIMTWAGTYNLPPEHTAILRNAWENISLP